MNFRWLQELREPIADKRSVQPSRRKCSKMMHSSMCVGICLRQQEVSPKYTRCLRQEGLTMYIADAETRRQSASDFTRALMEQFESRVTEIISRYIQGYLAEYASNPQANWKSKDTAIFLLTSIAARGSTAHHGVTSTNSLIDVVQFFSDHVVQDLQPSSGQASGASGAPHPIIVADAIKFLYTFRSQLTKEQLLSVIPMLSPHLQSQSFVIHTYAAMTIERVLFIKQNNMLV